MRTIDELIEELKHTTSIRFASKKKDDKALSGWILCLILCIT